MYLLALLLLPWSLSAVEVITITRPKSGHEFKFIATETAFTQALDKDMNLCKPRSVGLASNIREYYLASGCQAEFLKQVLNSGYKPIDAQASIFTK
jgi:hypothetical protein